MPTLPRRSQSYYPACEAAVNHQIHLELHVIYVYRSMASYFEKNVISKHMSQFFLEQSTLMKEHVDELIQLQNQLRGHTRLYNGNTNLPDYNYWDSSLKALDHALDLSLNVNQNLLYIRQLAREKGDARLLDFMEDSTLYEQVRSIRELRDHLSNFPMFPRISEEESLAENLLNQLSLDDKKKLN